MKKILVPISFSENSKRALKVARKIADRNKAHLSLIHCYPVKKYNREYDFGKERYDTGIRKMLIKFYNDTIPNEGDHRFGVITYPGSVSTIIANISSKFDLFVMTRVPDFNAKRSRWLGDRLFFISSVAQCPVLVVPNTSKKFDIDSISNIWHLKRDENEDHAVQKSLDTLDLGEASLITKGLQQHQFISDFWRFVVQYSKSKDSTLLQELPKSFDKEKIDLLILVKQNKSMFEEFLKQDIFLLLSQFDIPILILSKT